MRKGFIVFTNVEKGCKKREVLAKSASHIPVCLKAPTQVHLVSSHAALAFSSIPSAFSRNVVRSCYFYEVGVFVRSIFMISSYKFSAICISTGMEPQSVVSRGLKLLLLLRRV